MQGRPEPVVSVTSTEWRLDRSERATTAVAVATSTTLYMAFGRAYLARGVTGDLIGLSVLLLVLVTKRRRLRHEALLCLACIGGVAATRTTRPLRLPSTFWWGAVGAGLATYLTARLAVVPPEPSARA